MHSQGIGRWMTCVLLAAAGVAAIVADGLAGKPPVDPAFYQKRETWQETMLLSRDAIARQMIDADRAADDAAKAADPAIKSFQPWVFRQACTQPQMGRRLNVNVPVKIRVGGLKDLYLGNYVLGYHSASIATWVNARLIDKAGKATPLLSLQAKEWKGRPDTDPRYIEQHQLRISSAEGHYVLNGQYEWLQGQVTVQFGEGGIAWAHGRSMYEPVKTAYDRGRQVLSLIERDFSSPELKRERALEERDLIWVDDWSPGDAGAVARRYADACRIEAKSQLAAAATAVKTTEDFVKVSKLYQRVQDCQDMLQTLAVISADAMRLAVEDLTRTFPAKYAKGPEYLKRIEQIAQTLPQIRARLQKGDVTALDDAQAVLNFQKEALLANPLLDFDKLLFVHRGGHDNLGVTNNFSPNTISAGNARIDVLSPVKADGKVTTLFQPPKNQGVCDVRLNFDADKMLFTMTDEAGLCQVWEIKADGTGLRQITPSDDPKAYNNDRSLAVQNCDGCYLPDGRITFVSTATMVGVPCVGGSIPVGNTYLIDADGKNMRQLTFDQDQNWYPVVLNSGRVLYSRWEYTDTPHYFTRLLFSMNPDGTNQAEYYHTNSYWPNGIYYAKPIPNHPTKIVGVISGHHGVSRMGELVVFDPGQGHAEADGAVQRIPGYGKKVEPIIKDNLVGESWPKFIYPYPLSDPETGAGAGKYFLVSCKLTPDAPMGLYVADVFDNLVPLRIESDNALTEAIPFRKTVRPPVIPDRTDLSRKDAIVYLEDVYSGPGLDGIPRGSVKKLRVFSYDYNYRFMGSHCLVGQESGWDVKRIIGTVPVESDGSARFTVPANTAIGLQPLDADGRALQLMRSWMTAMPGETLSCIGCHENPNSAPSSRRTIASGREPAAIAEFHGPARGFSYERELQPVLDQYCAGCHNGQKRADGTVIPDFASRELQSVAGTVGKCSASYFALSAYVRRPGPESDYHMFFPMEYHADTSELVQMLKKGHHGVTLDAESWERLYTWIDLNVPFYGTYKETQGKNAWNPRSAQAAARHLELLKRYAGVDIDPEAIWQAPQRSITPIVPKQVTEKIEVPHVAGWPFNEKDAKARQASAAKETVRTLNLSDRASLTLALIPAGEFVMGDAKGYPDERPLAAVKIDKPFWMATTEITNRQFALFDPSHDSRFNDAPGKDQNTRGYPANTPEQPVIRITWKQAMAYCDWLSQKTGQRFSLPTEAQWEWAARAGEETVSAQKVGRVGSRFGAASNVGGNAANAWGLYDMYGNVSEWTRTSYRPFPYNELDGRNNPATDEMKVARGASWNDNAYRARAGLRLSYQPYQRVYNVGFRVICDVDAQPVQSAQAH